ncbi:hypothetical protein GGS26DRAFT_558020 [Hypomontagnella submonticulosa]|nr:hypothetical protein GGS26DRAFT_558020 [Hypomontagnella submonticulosa]
MDITQKGWEITALFPGKDGKNDNFTYQGDYESNTLLPVTRENASNVVSESDPDSS